MLLRGNTFDNIYQSGKKVKGICAIHKYPYLCSLKILIQKATSETGHILFLMGENFLEKGNYLNCIDGTEHPYFLHQNWVCSN